jgi:phosphoribosylglycinamide formyltransferase-1
VVRLGVVASTGGSVVARAAAVPCVRDGLAVGQAVRDGGAVTVARDQAVPGHVEPWQGRDHFGAAAATVLRAHGVDAVVVFFTRLLAGPLLREYDGCIYNFHPSLLPAFPGLHGVEDALAAGVLTLGTTVHLVDAGVDTGPLVLQTVLARPAGEPDALVRHRVFEDQCRTLVQLVHWLDEGRIDTAAGTRPVRVRDASYDGTRFVPALEHPDAIDLAVPRPDWLVQG